MQMKNKLGGVIRFAALTLLTLIASLGIASLSHAVDIVDEDEYVVFYNADLLGNPIAATDEYGRVMWREHFSPYGESSGRVNHDLSIKLDQFVEENPTRIGFTGHVKDNTVGLTYMEGRYYEAETARFVSNDPVSFVERKPLSANRYLYANNNPYSYADPNGEFAFLIPVAVFLVKEAAAEVASHYTGGATDFLSARRMATKIVKKGAGQVSKLRQSSSPNIQVQSAGGGDVRPATVVRNINRTDKEKIIDLEKELAQRTYETGGKEHAIISLKDGTRQIVSGGSGGIEFGSDLKRVITHTHPSTTGPSDADFKMLEATGQTRSYIYELFGGKRSKFTRR